MLRSTKTLKAKGEFEMIKAETIEQLKWLEASFVTELLEIKLVDRYTRTHTEEMLVLLKISSLLLNMT